MNANERETLNRFRAWQQVQGLSQTQAARRLGVSGSTLSQVYSETYKGDIARVVEKMGRALARADRRERAPKRPPFVMTSVAEEVLALLRQAHDEGCMVGVLGKSGVGKTTAVEVYLKAEPETILITMRPSGRRGSQGAGRPLLHRITKALGLECPYHTSNMDLIEQVGAALKGTGRLVIIDEIDYAAEDVLQGIRMVHDISGAGIALVGTLSFLERLRRKNTSTLNQFLNRIATSCKIDGITEEDCDKITAALDLPADARAAARSGARGVARRLAHGLVGAQRIARDESATLSAKTLQRAFGQLLEA